MPLTFYKIAVDSYIILVHSFHKFAILDIVHPRPLIGLLPRLAYVHSCSILLVICERALEGISICIGKLSLPVNLIVFECANVGEGLSAFGNGELTVALFFALNEFTLVNIAVAVFQDALSVELAS